MNSITAQSSSLENPPSQQVCGAQTFTIATVESHVSRLSSMITQFESRCQGAFDKINKRKISELLN